MASFNITDDDNVTLETNISGVQVVFPAGRAPAVNEFDLLASTNTRALALIEFVRKLRAKGWQYSCILYCGSYEYNSITDDNMIPWYCADIISSNEKVGRIMVSSNYSRRGGEWNYQLANDRAENQRRSRGGPYTSNVDKAVKLVKEYCSPMKPHEVYPKLAAEHLRIVHASHNSLQYRLGSAQVAALYKFATRDESALRAYMAEQKVKFPEDVAGVLEANEIHDEYETNKEHHDLVFVRKHPDTERYEALVKDSEGVTYSRPLPSEYIGQCKLLGMLGNGENIVPNRGVKLGNDEFAILIPKGAAANLIANSVPE
jgi:hypothetical protein